MISSSCFIISIRSDLTAFGIQFVSFGDIGEDFLIIEKDLIILIEGPVMVWRRVCQSFHMKSLSKLSTQFMRVSCRSLLFGSIRNPLSSLRRKLFQERTYQNVPTGFIQSPLIEEQAPLYSSEYYHPVRLGDTFKDGRYVVTRKLGFGVFSIV